jgi:tetratricopeptide (TPR) repeat protein
MKNLNRDIKYLMIDQRYEEALNILIHEINFKNAEAEIYALVGKCFLGSGDSSNAIRSFKRALEQDECNIEYHLMLAEAYEVFGENFSALDTYLKVLTLSPKCVSAAERVSKLVNTIRQEDIRYGI